MSRRRRKTETLDTPAPTGQRRQVTIPSLVLRYPRRVRSRWVFEHSSRYIAWNKTRRISPGCSLARLQYVAIPTEGAPLTLGRLSYLDSCPVQPYGAFLLTAAPGPIPWPGIPGPSRPVNVGRLLSLVDHTLFRTPPRYPGLPEQGPREPHVEVRCVVHLTVTGLQLCRRSPASRLSPKWLPRVGCFISYIRVFDLL